MSQELKNYIKAELEKGTPQEEIKELLITRGGWSEREVNQAIDKSSDNSVQAPGSEKRSVVGKWLKRLGYLVGLIIVVNAAYIFPLPIIMGYIYPDIKSEEIDDGLLALETVDIPEKDNGYFVLESATAALNTNSGDSDILNNTEIPSSYSVEDFLKRNEEALDYFYQAAEMEYVNPEYINLDGPFMNARLPDLVGYRQLGVINSIRMRDLAENAQLEKAYDYGFAALDVGMSLHDAPIQSMVENLVAKSILKNSLEGMLQVTLMSSSTPESIKDKIVNLEKYKDTEKGTVATLKTDYYYLADSIDAMYDGRLEGEDNYTSEGRGLWWRGGDYYLQPNRTKQLGAELTFLRIADVENNTKLSEEWLETLSQNTREETSKPYYVRIFYTQNAFGKIIFEYSGFASGRFVERDRETKALVSANQLTLALRAYYEDNAELPPYLGYLTEYFDALPVDPFSGEDFKYDADRKVIYSVGPDGKDDGGLLNDEQNKDLVFSVDFKSVQGGTINEVNTQENLE